jgi:hypothetical protein
VRPQPHLVDLAALVLEVRVDQIAREHVAGEEVVVGFEGVQDARAGCASPIRADLPNGSGFALA